MRNLLLEHPISFAERAWALLGELHPALVHFPVALLVTAGSLLLLRVCCRSISDEVISTCLYLGAGAALLAAIAGWSFGQQRYRNAELWSADTAELERLLWHRWLGIALTLCALGSSWLRWRWSGRSSHRWASSLPIVLCAVLAGVTGHLGGTLTFGEGFVVDKWKQLWAPHAPALSERARGEVLQTPQSVPSFELFEPARQILSERCIKCHGARSSKGGLSLHLRERALAGGDSGPALSPRDGQIPLLLQRVDSQDDELLMPPPDQGGPLSPTDRLALRRWIEAEAPWPQGVEIERKR